MDQSSDPLDQANEADLAEQRAPVAETPPPDDRPDMSSEEANEADVAEQRTPVVETSDDDGEDYPRE
jgi:hypothetical protein